MKNISYFDWYAVRYMYTVNATNDRSLDRHVVSRTTHAPLGQGTDMLNVATPTVSVIDRTKRLVDQLDPAILAQQIEQIKSDLADAKKAGQKNRAKSLRRALRTRDCYLSRENAKPASPAESAPVVSTTDDVIAPAKKARAKKAK